MSPLDNLLRLLMFPQLGFDWNTRLRERREHVHKLPDMVKIDLT